MKINFIQVFNKFLADLLNIDSEIFDASLKAQILHIIKRSRNESSFWLERIKCIQNYSREQAISELIRTLKIYEKLNQIDAYIRSIS